MTTDAIDLTTVVWHSSPNVADWPITSEITELGLRSGALHLRHTKEDVWPDVPFETTTQEATLYVFVNINGQWHGAGAERIRPNQRDKPEPSRVSDWIAEWLYNPQLWGPMAGYHPQPGELVGLAIAAGIGRAADTKIVAERTPVYLIAWPTDAGGSYPPWAGASVPLPPSQADPPATPLPPASPAPPEPSTDLATVLAVVNRRFDQLEAKLDRGLVGTADLPTWLGGRQIVRLKPDKTGADGTPQ